MRPSSFSPHFHPCARARALALVLAASLCSCAGTSSQRVPEHLADGAAAKPAGASIPAALKAQVEVELERRVAEAEGGNNAGIRVQLFPPASAPQRVLVVVAQSQGRGIQVLELAADPRGSARFASVVARELPPPNLDSGPPAVEYFYKVLGAADASRLLQRAALAISADIEAPVALLPSKDAHETQVLGVRLWTADGRMIDRRFDGAPSNLTEPRRAPVALIREDLEALIGSSDRTGVNAELRAMIVDAWPTRGAMPAWSRARLLAVAAALPSHPLVALVRPDLDEAGEPRVRAINALAAATEVDLRRDANGGLRSVDEVAEAYRQLLQR